SSFKDRVSPQVTPQLSTIVQRDGSLGPGACERITGKQHQRNPALSPVPTTARALCPYPAEDGWGCASRPDGISLPRGAAGPGRPRLRSGAGPDDSRRQRGQDGHPTNQRKKASGWFDRLTLEHGSQDTCVHEALQGLGRDRGKSAAPLYPSEEALALRPCQGPASQWPGQQPGCGKGVLDGEVDAHAADR